MSAGADIAFGLAMRMPHDRVAGMRLLAHFGAPDREPVDADDPIPGQVTVYDALADTALPAQEDRSRDEQHETVST